MCLQNYLIFYLEVIPPLSSFIALSVTEVGERHPLMRPSRLPSAGSVYGPSSGRQRGPRSPSFQPLLPSPTPAFSTGRPPLLPCQVRLCVVLPNVNFIVFPSDREAPFREAVVSEWVANATAAKAGALVLPGPRLRLGIFRGGPCSLSSGSLTFKGQEEP